MNISHQLFDYTINFVNSQRENTNSKSDFVLKTLIKLRQHLSFPDNIFQYKYPKDIYSFSNKILKILYIETLGYSLYSLSLI